jgi:hypothetical protein
VLLFVGSAQESHTDASLVDAEVVAPTLRLALDDTTYLKQAPAAAHVSRVEQGLRALLTFTTVINAARSETDLQRELAPCTSIYDVTPDGQRF